MPEQLVLDLPTRSALGRGDFFVSPSNDLALQALDRWPNWPNGKLALCGPAASGKTHLVHVWSARSNAVIISFNDLAHLDVSTIKPDASVAIEDLDKVITLPRALRVKAEEALFHLHNHLANGGGSLLVTGIGAPARWEITLPDLASRLQAVLVATLDPPDDTLISAVLVKLFEDRQLNVSPDLIQYLLSRIDRSFISVKATVEALDKTGLSRRRAITPRFAGEVLRKEFEQADDEPE